MATTSPLDQELDLIITRILNSQEEYCGRCEDWHSLRNTQACANILFGKACAAELAAARTPHTSGHFAPYANRVPVA